MMSRFATAPRPINRILVANRGEIACRVFATCRRLGIGTVAVHSDADAGALHVRSADEAIRIGPAPAVESYLRIEAIIEAARTSGADAVHPGYGFLSESAAFARACTEAGLVFIGPSAGVIAAMGSKIEAKKAAQAAGVPIVPGYHGDDQSPERLLQEARLIGYPVLIKASAGGGGRGMRRVDGEAELAQQLQSARQEALSAFGDGSVLLEKLVTRPRHLEVQLAGDDHGNLVHLFERDCSVQRNNQKVFEEAPAPNLSDAVRAKLYERALKLGRNIGYSSAGTVEFIMEAGADEPYFLEMNTRLQVEHPVTEAITGIDLVEWQIMVAAGQSLPARQEEIRQRGHAIEARIAAERPELGYQPATGRIKRLSVPRGVRFDTGIAEGSEIGVHYDSMVAKLVVHGASRAAAVARLDEALARLAILGVATNAGMLRSCVSRPAFLDGTLTTDFLADAFPGGWVPDPAEIDGLAGAAAIAWVEAHMGDAADPWRRASGFRVMGQRRPAQVELTVSRDGAETAVTVFGGPSGLVAKTANGVRRAVPEGLVSAVEGDVVMAAAGGLAVHVHVGLAIEKPHADGAGDASGTRLAAPLPGVVTALFAAQGDLVKKGDDLIQMEAMKLVHTLRAPSDGFIGKIHQAIGDVVATGAMLIEIIPQEGS
jgi:3-methylcrotonyl-CoA carboxylase alpha subunit